MRKWAETWQNQQNECAPSVDSDQPGHPPSLIRVFACAQWVPKDPSFLLADSEDCDQTGRMPRLIRVFAGRTPMLLVLSCRDKMVEICYCSETCLWVFKQFGYNILFYFFFRGKKWLPFILAIFPTENRLLKIFLHIIFLFVNRFSKIMLHLLRQI